MLGFNAGELTTKMANDQIQSNKGNEKNEFTVAVETLAINHAALEQFLNDKYGPNHDLNLPDFNRLYQGLNPSDRVPLDMVSLRITALAKYLNEPNLGLRLADYLQGHHQRISLFINNTSFKFIDLLKMLGRYVRVASDIFDIKIEETEQHLIFHYIPNCPDTVSYHQSEGFAAMLVRTFQAFQGIDIVALDLAHPKPTNNDQLYIESYGLLPDFATGHNKVYFDIESRDRYISGAVSREDSLRTLQSFESKYTKVAGENSMQERCVFLLPLLLCLGEPSKESLAELLCISPRTLQRKLKEEGTSFRELLQQLRVDLSDHHFRKSHATCTELAFALGYRDYKQFHRAFKSWFGVTPEQYRSQVLS